MNIISKYRFLWLACMIFTIVSAAQAQSTVFTPAVNYSTGGFPFSVTTGDFNNDGKKDLITANQFDDSISVILGNGDGTFQPAANFSIAYHPLWIAVEDFNGDNNDDLAVTNQFGNNMGILLGNGNGTFQNPVYYPTVSRQFGYPIVTGDLNNDNHADIAVLNYPCYQCGSSFSIFLSNGNGTFQNAITTSTGGSGSQSLELGDLNADGNLDIVISNADSDTLSVKLGNGNGTFQSTNLYPTGRNPVSVKLADFNQDNQLDLAVTTYFNNRVNIRFGNGNGTFQNEAGYGTGTNPGQVIAEDFDGNGSLDLAVTNINGNGIGLLYNNGNGTFQIPENYLTGSSPFSLTAADFNDDGRIDISVANRNDNNVSVLLNMVMVAMPCTPQPLGLLGWWSAEDSGLPEVGSNVAVPGNGAQYGSGKVGQAFQFDGINDYVDIGTFGVLPTYTVALWFNADIVDTNRTFISQDREGVNDDFMLGIEPEGHNYTSDFNRITVVFQDDATQSRYKIRDTVDAVPGRWYFVAVTYDGTTMRLWVDGVEKGNVTMTGLAISNQQWNLGQNSHYFPLYSYRNYAGRIDEPIIADRAFTQAEINSIYLAGQSGICKDSTPPITTAITTPEANPLMWNNSDVEVLFTADDGSDGTGVKQITYGASGAQTIAPTIVNGSAANLAITEEGETTITYFAEDNAGNIESAQTIVVKIDKTAPTISIASPINGNYLLNQAVTVSFNCADALSGVAGCTGTTANGNSLDTAAIGAKTFTVNASDNAGNSLSSTVNYNVVYGLQVLFDQTKAHKSGSTIPIKIRLVDANGANVSTASTIVHAVSIIQLSNQASTSLDDAGNSNPDFDFRYDESLGGYIFNLKTTGYSTGTFQLNFTVGNSPTIYSVLFQVRQ